MPLFELPADTECTLTSFTGRTQKHGPDDVPAVSFRLVLKGVRNELLDQFSPTIRHVAYAPVEGQEQLPGIEVTTPVLRSKDLTDWSPPDTVLEGWALLIARGITDDTALQMGSCKLDDFRFHLYDGGHVDCDFRVGTADVDEAGAGMLWGRQKRKVFVGVTAPEMPQPAIDGTKEAFDRDHPDQGSLIDHDAAPQDPTDALVRAVQDDEGDDHDGPRTSDDMSRDPEPEQQEKPSRRARRAAAEDIE